MISSITRLHPAIKLAAGALALVAVGVIAYISALDTPAAPPVEYSLPEEDRAYIWDIEHHVNLLGEFGFRNLANALRDDNASQAVACFADNFEGQVPAGGEEVSLNDDVVKVTRLTETGSFTRRDRHEFVKQLLSYRKHFCAPPKVKIAVQRIFPSVRRNLDSPWNLDCVMRLWGDWQKDKPAEVEVLFRCTMRRPGREPADQKGFLYTCVLNQIQVGKAEHFLFHDVARERGIDPGLFHDNWKENTSIPNTGGVYVCDFDRDGYLDILITDIKRTVLYRGLPGGRFEDVTRSMGLGHLKKGLYSICWVDIDGDGWPDLILANPQDGLRIFRNEEGKHFADYTKKSNLKFPLSAATITAADFDKDGRLDLFVSFASPRGKAGSWLTSRTGTKSSNRLLRNLGNWQFQDVTRISGTGGDDLSSFTAVWLDANNDNWPDLHVTNELGDGELLINQGDGTFVKKPLSDQPVDFGTMGASAGDLDNDGNIDLYLSNMYSKAGSRIFSNVRPDTYPPDVMHLITNFVKGNSLHHNLGDLKFQEIGKKMQVNAAGWAYGNALADMNNDGFLDIFCTAGFISKNRNEPDG
jgi:hypothetical protein